MLSLFTYLGFILEAFSCFLFGVGVAVDGQGVFPKQLPDPRAFRILVHRQMHSAGKCSSPSTVAAAVKGEKKPSHSLQPLEL